MLRKWVHFPEDFGSIYVTSILRNYTLALTRTIDVIRRFYTKSWETAVVLVSHNLHFQIVPSSKNKIWIKLRLKFNEFIYDICTFVYVCVFRIPIIYTKRIKNQSENWQHFTKTYLKFKGWIRLWLSFPSEIN